MTVTVVTVGHGARAIDVFVDLLVGAGVRRLVDIRTAPASRKHPQFGKDALSATLEGADIAYEWWGRELGGWRRPRVDSRHTALRSPGFRGYADHMETGEFRAALDRLIASSRDTRTAIMCAESLWWRCHRRMVADALVAAGCRVEHLMEGGGLDPHHLSPAARLDDGVLVYDVVTSGVSPGGPPRTRRAAPSDPPAG